MDLETLNRLPDEAARSALLACCGAHRWAAEMARRRPFADPEELLAAADDVWWALSGDDWREAFAAHPRIGEPADGEGTSARWSEGEQAGAASADSEVKAAIAAGNHRYEERFGHIFLISASGKTGREILAALERRLASEPAVELRTAAAEQAAITRRRLERLLEE